MRFPEFSGEWKKCRLGELAIKVGSGTTPKGGVNVYKSTGHYFIRSQNVGNGVLLLNDIVYIDEKTHQRQISTELKKDDVLLNITGASIGRCAIATSQVQGGNVNQHVCIIRLKEAVNPLYICYFLLSHRGQKQIDSFQAGGNRQGLNFEQIKSFSLFLPMRDEQDKISRLLFLLSARIATQNKIIEDLEQLKSAIRERLYTQIQEEDFEHKTIKDVLSYEHPTKYIVVDTEYTDDKKLTPVLTANKAFILGYTPEQENIYGKGDCIIFDDFTMDIKFVSFPFKIKSSAIKILTAKTNVNLYFIYEYLLFLNLISEEHKRHYISEIEPLHIVVPCLVIQHKIAEILQSIDKQIHNARQLQSAYQRQKQYLLNQMFI